MHYSETRRDQRREWLRQNFFFECKCRACREDWGTFEEIPLTTDNVLRQKIKEIDRDIAFSLSKGDTKKACDLHFEDIKLLEENVSEPHRLLVTLRNSLQCVLWQKYGI